MALTGSWPIVTAGMILSLPLLPVAMGPWSLDTALWGSTCVELVILALVGILAGNMTQETWPRRIWLAVSYAGLGLAIVAVALAVHH